MSSTEIEEHRRGFRDHLAYTSNPARTLTTVPTLTTEALTVWLVVCLPIAWGVWMTLQRAAVLL